jgi:hypothetical protein
MRMRFNSQIPMRPTKISAAAQIAALLAGVALLDWPARSQSADDRTWADKNFVAAFDEFFPIKHAEGDFIAARAHRDGVNDLPEFSVVIENTDNPRATRGILREAQGAPLYQQLVALHAKDPERTYDQLKQDLKVQVWNFTPAQCPAVSEQYKAFENIAFVRPRDDDATDEHPIMYQFNESIGGGDSEVMEYVESRAFPKWANATHKAFDACAATARP